MSDCGFQVEEFTDLAELCCTTQEPIRKAEVYLIYQKIEKILSKFPAKKRIFVEFCNQRKLKDYSIFWELSAAKNRGKIAHFSEQENWGQA